MLMLDFKTRADVLQELVELTRVSTEITDKNARWTLSELELAINMGLEYWSGAVSLPADYKISDTGPVNLPWFIGTVERIYTSDGPVAVANAHALWDFIRLEVPKSAGDYTIQYPLVNGSCAIDGSNLKTTEEITAETEKVVVTGEQKHIPDMGVCKIADMWFAFRRGEGNPSQTTLEGLQPLPRGLDPLSLSTIAVDSTVLMGIHVPDRRLWLHLQYQAMAILHGLFSAHGSPTDIENHQWFMRWYDAKADAIWEKFKPRMVQSRIVLK